MDALTDQDIGDDPSPEQIRLLCEQIRRGWSAGEERKRRTGSRDRDHGYVKEVQVIGPERHLLLVPDKSLYANGAPVLNLATKGGD